MIILLTLLNDARDGVDVLPYLVFYVSIIGKVTSALSGLTKTLQIWITEKNTKRSWLICVAGIS